MIAIQSQVSNFWDFFLKLLSKSVLSSRRTGFPGQTAARTQLGVQAGPVSFWTAPPPSCSSCSYPGDCPQKCYSQDSLGCYFVSAEGSKGQSMTVSMRLPSGKPGPCSVGFMPSQRLRRACVGRTCLSPGATAWRVPGCWAAGSPVPTTQQAPGRPRACVLCLIGEAPRRFGSVLVELWWQRRFPALFLGASG